MKKLTYTLLLLSLCFSFVTCGGNDDEDDDKDDNNEFVWNGDWNDPNDPNFKKEGYNPIKGKWIEFENPNFMHEFDENFQMISYNYRDSKWVQAKVNPYKVNDTALRYEIIETGHLSYYEYKQAKENGRDILYLRRVYKWGEQGESWKKDDDWEKYFREE